MPKNDQVKTTGRGFLIITAAKIWFLITGAIIQLGLPIFLGSAEQFGVFKIVTEAMSLLNMVMITGTLQAVSKLVSEQPHRANEAVNLALKLQLLLGVPLAVAYGIGAPWIADSFNDPNLSGLIRLSSLIVLFYAFYAIFVGYLNGLQEFVKQATLDISFATLKTVGILALVFLGFGVAGAVSGFVAAAGIICITAAIWTFRVMRQHKAKEDPAIEKSQGEAEITCKERESAELTENNEVIEEPSRTKRLFHYLILFMIYTVALNLVMRMDLFVLKSTAAKVPASLASIPDITSIFESVSNKFAGYYGAVLNLSRIPYQGIIAITFVIFPMISEATFRNEIETTRQYITNTFRYCTLLTVGIAILLATNADSIIAVLYSSDYQAASKALAILSISIIFFALLYVGMTVLMSAGRARAAVIIMSITSMVSGILNYFLIKNCHVISMYELTNFVRAFPASAATHTINAPALVENALDRATEHAALMSKYVYEAPEYMIAAAKATCAAMIVGCLISMFYILLRYRAGIPLKTLGRVVVGIICVVIVDRFTELPAEWIGEFGRVVLLGIVALKMAFLGVIFLLVLLALREFNQTDFDRVKRVIGR